MKYILDSMLNGLETYTTRAGINCVTATFALRHDNNSSVGIPDGSIFRFVLEKKFKLVALEDGEDYGIITSDKQLVKYCEAFGIYCKYIEKPETSQEFKEVATRLVDELKNSE